MTSLIKPICYPQPYSDESPMGYLIRVCEANQFNNVRWLYPEEGGRFVHLPKDILCRLVDSPWSGFDKIQSNLEPYCELKKAELNYTVLRFCPKCLEEDPYYRIDWHLRSSVACVKHQCWLVDSCRECHTEQSLSSKKSINECLCGCSLASTPICEVPDAVLRYQQFINGPPSYRQEDHFWLAEALKAADFSLEYRVQVAQVFAQWQPIEGNVFDKTGTFSGFTDMETARPYVLSLGEAYFSNPDGFNHFLEHLHHHVHIDQKDGDKLFKRFFKAYFMYIDTSIEPLHAALSHYVNNNWHYALTQKNTLFSESMIESHPWIPLQVASKRYDIGKSVIERAIDLGQINSKKRKYAESGRTFTLVFAPDIHKYISKADEQVNGVVAASILGVTKKQFYQLVESDYLDGKPPSDETGTSWSFERSKLHALLERFSSQLPAIEDQYIPLPEALRKIGNRIEEPLVSLLKAIEHGEIKAKKVLKNVGLRSLCVSEQQLLTWYGVQVNEKRLGLYTINELIKATCTSSELINQLIKKGLLQSFKKGDQESRYIPAKSVDSFKERYVLLTKLSNQSGMAFHELRPLFKKHGIEAIDQDLPKEERFMNRIFYRHDLIKVKEISGLVGTMGDWDYMG